MKNTSTERNAAGIKVACHSVSISRDVIAFIIGEPSNSMKQWPRTIQDKHITLTPLNIFKSSSSDLEILKSFIKLFLNEKQRKILPGKLSLSSIFGERDASRDEKIGAYSVSIPINPKIIMIPIKIRVTHPPILKELSDS